MSAPEQIRQLFLKLSAEGAAVEQESLVSTILEAASEKDVMLLARAGAKELVIRALLDDEGGPPIAEEELRRVDGCYRTVYRPLGAP